MSRNYRGLDVAVTVQHVAQHIVQPRQRRFPCDVIRSPDLALRDQPEGPPFLEAARAGGGLGAFASNQLGSRAFAALAR